MILIDMIKQKNKDKYLGTIKFKRMLKYEIFLYLSGIKKNSLKLKNRVLRVAK